MKVSVFFTGMTIDVIFFTRMTIDVIFFTMMMIDVITKGSISPKGLDTF